MEKFFNIHKNCDIYIVCSGKSLDFFSLDFIENKISIGINQIYKKLKTNYLVVKDHKVLKSAVLQLDDNQTLFVSKGNYGELNEINEKFILNNYKNKKNIIIFEHEKNNHSIFKLPKNEKNLVVSYSTVTSAIHLAAYMGAKNIVLVGHDCGSINGEINCSDYHTEETYRICWKNGSNDYRKWLRTIEKDTVVLRTLLREKYKCNLYSLNPFINLGLEGNKYEVFTKKGIFLL